MNELEKELIEEKFLLYQAVLYTELIKKKKHVLVPTWRFIRDKNWEWKCLKLNDSYFWMEMDWTLIFIHVKFLNSLFK